MKILRLLVICALILSALLAPAIMNIHPVLAAPTLSPLPSTVKTCGVITSPGTYLLDPAFKAATGDVSTAPDGSTTCILMETTSTGAIFDLHGVRLEGPGFSGAPAIDVGVWVSASMVTITDLCRTCSATGGIEGWQNEGVVLDTSSTRSAVGVSDALPFSKGITIASLNQGMTILGADNIVSSNPSISAQMFGSGLSLVGPFAHDNLISGNVISSNFLGGLGISGSNNNTIQGNAIIDNGSGEGGSIDSGIVIRDGSSNVIQGNVISHQSFGLGIEIHGGCCTLIGGPSAHFGNNITFNGNGGILVEDSPSTIVEHNSVDFNKGFGLGTNSHGTLVRKNDFSHNGGDGIQLAASSSIITGNSVNGNGRRGIVIGDACVGDGHQPLGTGYGAFCFTTSFGPSPCTPSGNNNEIGGRGSHASQALSNALIVNGHSVDYYWDGMGTGNTWLHDDATSGSFSASPPTPATGPGSVNFFIDDGTPPTESC